MNHFPTFEVLVTLVILAVSLGPGVVMGVKYVLVSLAESELPTLARALKLRIDGEGLRGSRRGVLIRLERLGAPGNELRPWQLQLLDPQGPAGLELGPTSTVFPPRRVDVALGDQGFDDVVVVADDPGLALASLPPRSRETVRDGIRQGWLRQGAAWQRSDLRAIPAELEIAIEQGLRLCTCLRWEGVGMRHRLRMRCADPVPEVAAAATRVRFDKGWIDDDELPSLLHHREADVAIRAACRLHDLDWLAGAVRRSAGLELRLRAVLALHALGADERLPPAVEALLLRGLGGDLRVPCLEALADLGGERALAELEGVAGGEPVRARIRARRSQHVGGVSIAESDGGELAVAEVDGAYRGRLPG